MTPQSRVDQQIHKIDQEVHEENGDDENHHHIPDDDQVTAGDAVEEEAAQAWDHEDPLDDDRTDQQGGKLQPEHGDNRHGCVSKSMSQQDLARTETLAAG